MIALLLLTLSLCTTPGVCCTIPRDSHHRIIRSREATREFKHRTGYPHGRPGYVIDHICPLECCGADAPRNMQWQTVEEARRKDRWEGSCTSCRPELMR